MVLTGALATIVVDGIVIGRMRGVQFTETLRRQDVRGIGTTLVQESPVMEHGGTLRADFYEVDFANSGLPRALRRDVQTKQEFEDNLLLVEGGIQVNIYKKETDVYDPSTGKVKAKKVPYAVLTRVLLDSEDININEGQVSGRSQTFRFLDPILFPA